MIQTLGTSLGQVADAVLALGGEVDSVTPEGAVHYYLDGLPGYAYDKGGEILRSSVFLSDHLGILDAVAWVKAQPRPRSGSLEVSFGDNQQVGRVRLLFERSLPLEREEAARIPDEVLLYADAWDAQRTVLEGDLLDGDAGITNVLDRSPQSAWLLFGSRASLPTEDELRVANADAKAGLNTTRWTVPKHVQPGDLVFVYFTTPLKEIRYVARVASQPFFDTDNEVNAEATPARQQWWAWLTPLVQVRPLPLTELQAIAGERVVGRAHGGIYLRPELADLLSEHFASDLAEANESVRRVCQPVVEREGLHDPAELTLEQWRVLPAAALRVEKEVELHVAEPLVRWLLESVSGAEVQAQAQFTQLVPDYAVRLGGEVRLVVEVKQRIRRIRGKGLTEQSEVAQLRRYMEARRCNGLLIDAHRAYFFDHNQRSPLFTLDRATATGREIALLADLVRAGLQPD